MEDKEVIWSRDAEGRAILEEIAAFDSVTTGKVNLTRSLHVILIERLAQLQADPRYRKWKKERTQT